MKSHVVTHLTS